jgi:hypothetical protein
MFVITTMSVLVWPNVPCGTCGTLEGVASKHRSEAHDLLLDSQGSFFPAYRVFAFLTYILDGYTDKEKRDVIGSSVIQTMLANATLPQALDLFKCCSVTSRRLF